MWQKFGKVEVFSMKNGVFIFRFNDEPTCEAVLEYDFFFFFLFLFFSSRDGEAGRLKSWSWWRLTAMARDG
jgi:hypothetical protein